MEILARRGQEEARKRPKRLQKTRNPEFGL